MNFHTTRTIGNSLDEQFHNKLSFRHLQTTKRFVKQSVSLNMPVVNAEQAVIEGLDLDNFDGETAQHLSNCLFINQAYEPAYPLCTVTGNSLLPLECIEEINFPLWNVDTHNILSAQASYGQEKKAQSIRVVINANKYIQWIKTTLAIFEERLETIKEEASGLETQNIDRIISAMKEQVAEFDSPINHTEQAHKGPYEVIFFSKNNEAMLKKVIKQVWKQQTEQTHTSKDFTATNLKAKLKSGHEITINSPRDDIWQKINDVFIVEEFDGQGHLSTYFLRNNNISKAEIDQIRSTMLPIMQSYNTKLLRENSCIDLLDVFHAVLFCQSGADNKIQLKTNEERESARQFYWWAQAISHKNLMH